MNDVIAEIELARTDPLKSIQSRFVISTIGGQIGIIDLEELKPQSNLIAPQLKIYSKYDGLLLIERYIENLPCTCDVKSTLKNFLKDPNTKVYSSIAFTPNKVISSVLNLWVGYTVEPKEGDWSTLKYFLFEIISGGEDDRYEYLLNYLAHLFLKPHEKPGVMLALMSGQGSGKGTLGMLLSEMFKHTTIQLNQVSHVVTGFNAILERAYIVFLDEAVFAGDIRATEALKSIITEPFITIEEKRQPRRTIQSHHRFIAATNSAHFAKTEKDDRRIMYFRVSESKVNDMSYWEKVRDAIMNQEIQALAFDLLNRDISSFNPRIRPKVKELIEQKLLSLQGFERFLFEVLTIEKIGFMKWVSDEFISTELLKNAYDEFRMGTTKYSTVQFREIKNVIEKVLPSIKRGRAKVRGYELCHINQAREDFEKYLGGKVDWS